MYEILYLLLISIGINVLMFIPAFIFKTDKLTDLSYSLSFLLLIFFTIYLSNQTFESLLLTVLISLWAFRLGAFLFIRIAHMKKDKRFDGIRESFIRFSSFWLLQGLTVWLVLLPALFFISSNATQLLYGGLLLWLVGLSIESLADLQKYKFNQHVKNKGKFISSGLWKYSRHPNYFGEILCWLGIYIAVFPSLIPFERLIGLLSPLFITVLLLFFSGIPPLERYADNKWGSTQAYQQYKASTNILVLWFPKKKV